MADALTPAQGFEYTQTEAGWFFRPYQQSARRAAYAHVGCLMTLLAVFLIPSLGFILFLGTVVALKAGFPQEWLPGLALVGIALLLVTLLPLGVVVAKHIFRKSLRDNWKTLTITPNGRITLGDNELLDVGRARSVVVRMEMLADGEGGTSDYYYVDIHLDRTSAAPVTIPAPGLGSWNDNFGKKIQALEFAALLAKALGVPVVEEPPPS